MIKITMKNGETAKWTNYTDYKYDGKFFIVIRDGEWVGFYNLDHVISIVITQSNPHEKGKFVPLTTPAGIDSHIVKITTAHSNASTD